MGPASPSTVTSVLSPSSCHHIPMARSCCWIMPWGAWVGCRQPLLLAPFGVMPPQMLLGTKGCWGDLKQEQAMALPSKGWE